MVAAMDAVSVAARLLVSPFTMYRYDASYAIEVHALIQPLRVGPKPVDPTDPAVAERSPIGPPPMARVGNPHA